MTAENTIKILSLSDLFEIQGLPMDASSEISDLLLVDQYNRLLVFFYINNPSNNATELQATELVFESAGNMNSLG